jgi:hypothetical protein
MKASSRYVKVYNGQPCNVVCEANIIFCEASTGNKIKIPMMVVLEFTTNILSMKRCATASQQQQQQQQRTNENHDNAGLN